MRTTKTAWLVAMMMFGGTMIAQAECDKGEKRDYSKIRHAMKSKAGHSVRMMRGLDLTETQKEQIKAIHQENKEVMQAAMKNLKEAHKAFKKASYGSDDIDEVAIRDLASSVAEAMADMTILKAAMKKEIGAILTEDQKDKLEEKKTKMKERMSQMKEKMKARKGSRKECGKDSGCSK